MNSMSSEKEVMLCSTCKGSLHNPVMLECLHNCCRQCLQVQTVADSSRVICNACKDESAVSAICNNPFIEGRAKLLKIMDSPSECEECVSHGRTGEVADVLCRQCRKLLCHECTRKHSKYSRAHTVVSLCEIRSSSELTDMCTPLCRHHTKTFDHWCINCKLPKCTECALACTKIYHRLQIIGSPYTDDILSKFSECISDFQSVLENKVFGSLQAYEDEYKKLKLFQRAGENILQKNKKGILDALDKAFSAAWTHLQVECEQQQARIEDMKKEAQSLFAKASYALEYSKLPMYPIDVTWVLQQQMLVLSRFEELSSQLHELQNPGSLLKCIVIEGGLETHFANVIRSWLGVVGTVEGTDWKTYCESGLEPVESHTVSETDTATVSETDPATVSETDPATVSETDPATVSEKDPATVSETDPATMSEAIPATTPEVDPAIVSETEPATASDTNPATVSKADPATMSQADPAIVIEMDHAFPLGSGCATLSEMDSATLSSIHPAVVTELNPVDDIILSDTDPADSAMHLETDADGSCILSEADPGGKAAMLEAYQHSSAAVPRTEFAVTARFFHSNHHLLLSSKLIDPFYVAAAKAKRCKSERLRETRAFNFLCGGKKEDDDCRCLVAASSDVMIFGCHHPVIDDSFADRIQVHDHPNPCKVGETAVLRLPIFKKKKFSCKRCGCDWGACVMIDKTYFFFIKIDTLTIEVDGIEHRFDKWRDLPYALEPITDEGLLAYGAENIPADSPIPPRPSPRNMVK